MDHTQTRTLVIRPATPGDAGRVAVLSTQLGYPASETEMERRIHRTLQGRDQELFVAEADGVVVGWVQVFIRVPLMQDSEVEVGGLVIDENYRRRGVGRLLMQRAEQWAHEKGCRTVYLRSNVIRKDAHLFYEKLGYKVVKTQTAFRKIL
ncbi:MAG: GNAT family N-acetyltransferase [Bacteroidota bacterium]|jgi:GNAT superfamily N-acetyltransferase